jgi:hypothetical protein
VAACTARLPPALVSSAGAHAITSQVDGATAQFDPRARCGPGDDASDFTVEDEMAELRELCEAVDQPLTVTKGSAGLIPRVVCQRFRNNVPVRRRRLNSTNEPAAILPPTTKRDQCTCRQP